MPNGIDQAPVIVDRPNVFNRPLLTVSRGFTVGIVGRTSDDLQQDDFESVQCVATWISKNGMNLLTGGGLGVMKVASEAFVKACEPDKRGVSIGVIPGSLEGENGSLNVKYKNEVTHPNQFVEVPIYTQLAGGEHGGSLYGRNHAMALSPDVLVAMLVGSGTASEAALALNYGTPLVILANPQSLGSLFSVAWFASRGAFVTRNKEAAINQLQKVLERLGWEGPPV